VLIEKLTAQQAANVDSHLTRLRHLGAEIEVTSDTSGTAKRMRLPVKPGIVWLPGNVFMCPSCGQRFIVQPYQAAAAAEKPEPRVAAEPAAEQGAVSPAAPRPGHSTAENVEPQEITPKSETSPAGAAAAPSPAAPASGAPRPAGGQWSLREEEEQPPAQAGPQARPAPNAPPRSAERPQPVPQEKAPAAREVQQTAGKAPTAPRPREASARKTPAAPRPQPAAAAPAEPAEEPEIRILDEPTPQERGATEPQAESAEGTCRVTIVKKLKPKQRRSVAEIIARYQGIPVEEASRAAAKSVITVLRKASRQQAEECSNELKALGVTAQVKER